METTYFKHPLRFPKNADGPFYTTGHQSRETDAPNSAIVWCGDCLWCGAPEAEAPTLFAPFDDTYTDTYFVRQPSTPEETEQAIMSARVCCVSAVRYGGTEREIISKLGNDPAVCDYIVTESGDLKCTVASDGKLLPFAQAIVDTRQAESNGNGRGRTRSGGTSGDNSLLKNFATPVGLHIGWKVYGCTVGTVLVVCLPAIAKILRGQLPIPDLKQATLMLLGVASTGFLLGLLFSAKDYFTERISAGHHVAFPFRYIFCRGMWSLLLFWIPSAVTIVLIVLAFSLRIK